MVRRPPPPPPVATQREHWRKRAPANPQISAPPGPTDPPAETRQRKREAAKRGKADGDRKTYEKASKMPISPMWFGLLGFVVFGGLLFELL
ncbi:hypothetical protein H072_2923 [Dactylellina haptotyla CBS 200.50]|uniref:Stress-associated endoplasmic reticulum protein n=1 Tax=Dactylellina haptotyla (strain CBS 200.50) TaxID=1284197 RepID=S8C5S9_DACHA|nr:hypothetical protein H072_2923 [Dactylellina haptotyla CBS 200.50]